MFSFFIPPFFFDSTRGRGSPGIIMPGRFHARAVFLRAVGDAGHCSVVPWRILCAATITLSVFAAGRVPSLQCARRYTTSSASLRSAPSPQGEGFAGRRGRRALRGFRDGFASGGRHPSTGLEAGPPPLLAGEVFSGRRGRRPLRGFRDVSGSPCIGWQR